MAVINFSHTVEAKNGLHMRNSGALAALCKERDARIVVIHGDSGKQASAENPLSTMLLNIRHGDVLHFSVSAKQQSGLKEAIKKLL